MNLASSTFHSISHAFEQETKISSHKIAIRTLKEEITYGELNVRANQVAGFLRSKLKVNRANIGIYLEPSIEVYVAILGIVKAGYAFVVISSEAPVKHIQQIINGCHCACILTSSQFKKNMTDKKFIDIESLEKNSLPTENPQQILDKDSPVYIAYTSGSTGQPKGVIVTHANLWSIYLAWDKVYGLSKIKSHLQTADYTFDVFIGNFVRALCSGSTLVHYPKKTLLSPHKLYQLLSEEKIECAEFVPIIMRRLAKYLIKNNLKLIWLKLLICGSDLWTVDDYKLFSQVCMPRARLINSYGTTETTIDSTYFEDQKKHLPYPDDFPMPIGKPFANTEIYIVDQKNELIKHEGEGELYIGGDGVSEGYINNSRLTKEKFICAPWVAHTKKKVYKTGDKVQRLKNGDIVLVGRMDHQIKINGYRVEPSQIEYCLRLHPKITDCFVIKYQNSQAAKPKLAAYLVASNPESLTQNTLKEHLREHLPNYFIPAHFYVIDEMPISSSGKVVRKHIESAKLLSSLKEER